MEFRVLGPLEVVGDGGPIRLGGAKQRGLLALLLLHADEVVSSDRLIEELWAGEPPGTAQTALQGYVSQLRKTLGRDAVVTRAPGYVLAIAPEQLDLNRFQALRERARAALASGDAAQASTLLHEALSLWRGPPLADLAYESFAQTAIGRLEELHLAALEERLEADLALGRHADLVAEVEALVAEHPLRERLRRQLMLALYRSGRQAEALEAYQDARRALVDELGIEPGRALQELEKAILQQDPSLEPAAAAAAAPEPAAPARDAVRPGRRAAGAFVGREREFAQLEAGLEDALGGRGRFFLISGGPGLGKSRLADELASEAKARGALILWGRAWQGGGAPAYWPWMQLLRSYVRGREPAKLGAQVERAPDLVQLLPELRELVPALPEPTPLDSDADRFRAFDATASFLRDASREQPLVLVLDDLHAADLPSLVLLQFVANELAEMRVLAIGAYRENAVESDDPVAAKLAELARQPTHRLRLSTWSEDDVARLFERSAGSAPPADVVAAIFTETEGKPLLVDEIVRIYVAEGRLPPAIESLTQPRPS